MALPTNDGSKSDIYGRKMIIPIKPITADMCTIVGGTEAATTGVGEEILTGATSINISYQQAVVRRRTLGSRNGQPIAVIYPTQPMGTLTMQRLFAETPAAIFSRPGWNICAGTAYLDVRFNGDSAYADCNVKYGGFHITGATVTGYRVSAEAEGLTIVDDISIEFLQMTVLPA